MSEWERVEPCWYVNDLGGICRERDKRWYFFPASAEVGVKVGPFKSLRIAIKEAGHETTAGSLKQT